MACIPKIFMELQLNCITGGGAVVYRVALRYPKLISAFFSVCTPYFPPRKEYFPISALPNFKYQVQLASGEVEKHIVGEEKLGQLLNGMYGGRTPSGETTFDVTVGVVYDNLPEVGPSPLLSKEEIDFYVKRYAIHGIHGPLNVSKSLLQPLQPSTKTDC